MQASRHHRLPAVRACFASTLALERRIIGIAPYVIGSLAGFRFVQRVATFV
jgi:hypothetical protein